MTDGDPDGLSPRERQALALWRAPEPPPDLAARVLARLGAERGAVGGVRALAVAALAVALVGGAAAVRLLSAAGAVVPAPAALVGDGGVETGADVIDGVRS